jgi:hypothetical protein
MVASDSLVHATNHRWVVNAHNLLLLVPHGSLHMLIRLNVGEQEFSRVSLFGFVSNPE